ncbi:MAG: hypothetical protein J6A46_03790 [Clostridia bacterium]|nr:hypothetical protein [Clostridia bacterium]
MNERNAKERRVERKDVLEELLAMVRVCFEGEAILYDDELLMTLPTGDSFTLKVEKVA